LEEKLPIIYSDAAGKCEHCGKIIDMDEMPISMSTTWKCPHCGKEISREKTFGYERGTLFWRKVSWIDKNGCWTKDRPKREFIIGGYLIANKVSSLFFTKT
jgi:predicted RNA-binding Zn-ribbon protein involved in translation (DUF1610 family)